MFLSVKINTTVGPTLPADSGLQLSVVEDDNAPAMDRIRTAEYLMTIKLHY